MFLSLLSKRYHSVVKVFSKKEKSFSEPQKGWHPFSILFRSSADALKKDISPVSVVSLFLANLIISFQVELISGVLSNLLFFGISHGCALILAVTLSHYQSRGRRWHSIGIPAVILGFPFLVRALILFCGLWVSPRAVTYDAFVLYFDVGLFLNIVPFYWNALSLTASLQSRQAHRYCLVVLLGIGVLFFFFVPTSGIEVYQFPIIKLIVFSALLFIIFVGFIFSLPPALQLTSRERWGAISVAVIGILFIAALQLKPAEEGTSRQRGGLLQPDLFRFDFSQILKLESEIQLKDDLVLIVHKDDPFDDHIFLRRFILSGYNPKNGFFRDPQRDDPEHPQQLPGEELLLPAKEYANRKKLSQEYFIINFDPHAFIGMNQPTRITLLKSWNASSFNSAYRVVSDVSEVLSYELSAVDERENSTLTRYLSPEDIAWYTEYGKDSRIKSLSDTIVGSVSGYWDKVQAIYEYLKNGEYRYSLKPGIAPDGDQLGYFLFTTKKGYCSYFAFSMALLLRAQGIPSRVAVGFFIDPQENNFNYYPVRSNMAHAWVEVYFPPFGWIEYDPTTTQLAAGEHFNFSFSSHQDQFEKLLGEILSFRDQLVPLQQKNSDKISPQTSFLQNTLRNIRRIWPYLLGLLYLFIIVVFRFRKRWGYEISKDPRQKALFLKGQVVYLLKLAGYRWEQGILVDERLGRNISQGSSPSPSGISFSTLENSWDKLYFSASPDSQVVETSSIAYREFQHWYRRHIPWWRRVLGFLFPMLALVLPPTTLSRASPQQGGQPKRNRRKTRLLLFLVVWLPLGLTGSFRELYAQSGATGGDGSSSVYDENSTTPSMGVSETEKDGAALLEAAQAASHEERWEEALTLLATGRKRFPQDSRFMVALGDLYYNRNLYSLAYKEYQEAYRFIPTNTTLLYQLATVVARLNDNEGAIRYLKELLQLRPDDRDAINDLGWLYFKTHRLQEGEILLTEAIRRLGGSHHFYMTLATIYAEQYRYEQSKEYYLRAIQEAQRFQNRMFTAVAYYNLSILESRFYQFDKALEWTKTSLAAMERPSGHLARGELYLRRLDFPRTMTDYLSAYELDTTPLSTINLAQVYQLMGHLEEARTYGEHSLAQEDLSWIANYGTDVIRHTREIHRILEDTYRGLYYKKKVLRQRTFIELIKKRYHHYAFTLFSLKAAQDYAAQGQTLDAYKTYYDAFSDYPQRAIAYLAIAQKEEVEKIPASLSNYLLEEGIVRKDAQRIEAALKLLDPIWQRDLMQDGLVKLYELYRRQWAFFKARQIAEQLYALNPGYLLQNGIRLPLRIVFPEDDYGDVSPVKTKEQKPRDRLFIQRSLLQLLRRSNVEVMDDIKSPTRFTLFLRLKESGVELSMVDTLKGSTVQSKVLPFSFSHRGLWGNILFTPAEKESLLTFLFSVTW
ncbi:MAG: tetratricopeptide repeat protein [Treponemataceae bacterium]|nr:tetratricopeptide repeat protein [Treponemataceae bacterium]